MEKTTQYFTGPRPYIFISYSWEDDAHKEWVREFADRLISEGLNVDVDQYDLSLGDRLPFFMEQVITEADYVLIICTPTYKKKADKRKGGVGYEGHIISDELMRYGNERKFIPVIRKGSIEESLPNCLAGKTAAFMTPDREESGFADLVDTVLGRKRKPKPVVKQSVKNYLFKAVNEDEPIKLVTIDKENVTLPKMDGTKGSALYKVPLKLNRAPSAFWSRTFLEAWRFPPSFSLMHRPSIASVYGDTIALDGTTIEEVRDYHLKTVKLCIEVANKAESDLREMERKKEEAERRRLEEHKHLIDDVVDSLEL